MKRPLFVFAVILSLGPIACGGGVGSDRREPLDHAARRAEVHVLVAQLERNGDDAGLLLKLGNEYWGLGDLDAAQRAFKRGVEIKRDPEIQSALIGVLYNRGRYVEAQSWAANMTAQDTPAWLREVRDQFANLIKSSVPHERSVELRQVGHDLVNSIDMSFVEVPAGSFMRGDDHSEADTRPVREITLSAYRIGKYEVTWGQFKRFLEETHYRFVAHASAHIGPEFDDYPVSGVSWLDAQAFTIWLSGRERAVYRLPTEAEWEFAARGVRGYREPWGNERGRAQIDGNWGRTSRADLKASAAPAVRRVGSFSRDSSPFGIFDMAGNVKEWCLDEYAHDYYAWSPATTPYGPVERIGLKVLRGGSWNDPGPGDFAIRRSSAGVNQGYTGYGFRVVREVDGPKVRTAGL